MVKLSTIFLLWMSFCIFERTGILESFNIGNPLLIYFSALSPILMFVICRCVKRISRAIAPYIRRLERFLIVYVLFWVVQIFVTYFRYSSIFPMSFIMLVRKNLYWLDILMVYPICYILQADGTLRRFSNWIITIAFVGNLQRFVAWAAYSVGISSVFPEIIGERLSNSRTGLYRLGGHTLHSLGYDLTLIRYADRREKHRKIFFWTAVLFVLYQALIGQSRAHLLCYGITVIVFLYGAYSDGFSKDRRYVRLILSISLFTLTGYLLLSGIISQFLGTFSMKSGTFYAGSTINRLSAMEYYLTLLKKNPLFGIGFLYDDSEQLGNMYSILRGTYITGRSAYLEDLGLMGQLFQNGIIGFAVLMFIFYIMYKDAKKVYRMNTGDGQRLWILFVHMFFMSITTISIFLKNLFYTVPMYLAIFEFYYINNTENREG